MPTPLQIPGLAVDAAIGRGSSGVVYRAHRRDNPSQSVALKVFHTFDSEVRNSALRNRVHREAAFVATLAHPGLVRIFEVGEHRNRPFIAMEYVEGPSLANELVAAPMPFLRLFSLARSVAQTLAAVADRGIVHRDLKPHNILLPVDGQAKVIDFGLAAIVDELDEHSENRACGTCLYASPEQVGMLNRPVDGRSDLYSLGAVLFHCASGRAPFIAETAAEVVHQHAAAPVPDLRELNPNIPPGFAAIVTRLLAKDPDRRFQDGHELVAALDRLEHPGGAHRVYVAEKTDPILCARADEFRRLTEVAEGTKSPLLYAISGPSGSGARVVARAFASRLGVVLGADLITGVCTPEIDHPLRPIARGLDAYMAADDAGEHAQRLERVLENEAKSGFPLGPLLAPLCPQLRAFAGDHPPLATPDCQVSLALAKLLSGLAQLRPLVLLLEDLQWLDERGFEWLEYLCTKLDQTDIYIVCTSNVAPGSPAGARIEQLLAWQVDDSERESPTFRMELPALNKLATRKLLAVALGTNDLEDEVVSAICRRSIDQPEALIQCIHTLIYRGALRPHWGTWRIDQARLDRVAIPRDLEQTFVVRLHGLDQVTRSVLDWAALLGPTFGLEHLQMVCAAGLDHGDGEFLRAVEVGIRGGFIERVSYHLYRHVYPRLRQHLLDELSTAKKRAGHRKIAQALDEIQTPTVDEVLARARHYSLSLTPQSARRTDETNRIAGAWSARTGAAESAYMHLRAATDARAVGKLPRDPDLAAELGEICLRTGRIDEARICTSNLLRDATEPVARAQYRAQMAAIHRAELEFDRAWQELTEGFQELGIRSFTSPAQLGQVLAGRALARLTLPKRRLGDAARRRAKVLVTLCEYAALTACYDLRPDDMRRALLLPQYALSRLGTTAEVVGFETTAAFAFASFSEVELAQAQLARAHEHAQALNHPVLRSRCKAAQAAVFAFTGQSLPAESAFETALHDHGVWLDAVDYARSCVIHAWGLWLRGHDHQARALLQSGPRGPTGRPGIQPQARFWAVLGYWTASMCEAAVGHRSNARALVKRGHALTHGRDVGRFHQAYALMTEMLTALTTPAGPRGEQLEAWSQTWENLDLRIESTPVLLRPLWLARARIAARATDRFAGQPVPEAAVLQLQRRVHELTRAARSLPSLQAHTRVLEATLARLRGDVHAAMQYLGEAQTQAHIGDNPWVIFECTCERARVLRAMGMHEASQREARQAQTLATECGWTHRLQRLSPEFHLGAGVGQHLTSRGSTAPKPPGQLSRYLDALLAVSRVAVTGEDPEAQARQILDELVAALGAERALLYTCDEADNNLTFRAGRNHAGNDLPPQDNISSTVLDYVAATRTIKLISGDEDGEVNSSDSVIAHQLKSIVAAPLVVKRQLIGVVYLDNHLVRGLFSNDDLLILGAMCNHVAIALESARMARFMQNARDQALEAARLRSAFLTHMSHELRTPLNAILGYAEMVKEDVAKQLPDTLPDLERISVAGRHLLGIIADILELSKLESGNAHAQGTEIDVAQLVLAVSDPYHSASARSGNQLHVNCSPTLGTVFTDVEKLRRVLQHILDNAIKFTEGGQIDVRAEWRHHADGRRLAIEIADTGIGMTPEQLESLFTPFYQGDMSTTRRYGGTGIGMALSKHLVEVLGGSLYVESRSGRGTCFTIQLPPQLPRR